MKMPIACGVAVALLFSASTLAQEPVLSGKYSGGYTSNRDTQIRLVLDIKSVENGVVKGTISRYSSANRAPQCSGEFPLEGTLKGNQLRIRTAEGSGNTGPDDCVLRLHATVEGNKLLGKVGPNEFELTR
jgi:hypothetical protein